MKTITTTITYKEVELDITYEYSPEEKAVMYYKDGSGYPGCAEELNITEVYHNETDMYELLEDQFDELIEIIDPFLYHQLNNQLVCFNIFPTSLWFNYYQAHYDYCQHDC